MSRLKGFRKRYTEPPGMFAQILDMFMGIDTDRDGVPDIRDCRPNDPKKHSIRPSRAMRERLNELPVYVSEKVNFESDFVRPINPEHITHPRAKKLYPKATTAALSTIKKYPGIIGKIEKTNPTALTFVYQPGYEFGITALGENIATGKPVKNVYLYIPPEPGITTKEDYIKNGMIYITNHFPPEKWAFHIENLKNQAERIIFKGEEGTEVEHKKIRHSYATSAFHELTHVKQAEDVDKFGKRVAEEQKTSYHEQPIEIEAREKAKEEILKRIEKGNISDEELALAMNLLLREENK